MSAVYWEIGRRIVAFEQAGRARANYGERVIEQLSADLRKGYGRGFGRSSLFQIRAFYLAYREKVQTTFGQSVDQKVQTPFGQLSPALFDALRESLPLPWSQYHRLLSVGNLDAREFYETEALRGGWTARQLDRQIATRFDTRTAPSRNKAAMLRRTRLPPRPLRTQGPARCVTLTQQGRLCCQTRMLTLRNLVPRMPRQPDLLICKRTPERRFPGIAWELLL
jgi:hypothetical protein